MVQTEEAEESCEPIRDSLDDEGMSKPRDEDQKPKAVTSRPTFNYKPDQDEAIEIGDQKSDELEAADVVEKPKEAEIIDVEEPRLSIQVLDSELPEDLEASPNK